MRLENSKFYPELSSGISVKCKISLFCLLLAAYCMLPTAFSASAETKEFTLIVTDSEIELNGTKFMVWKYNDMFPGPEIRVKEGDIVRIKLKNLSSAKHGLFFHGLFVNPRVSLQEQEIFVDPGYEYTYGEFTAKPPGTHLYHCNWNMAEHISRGLYGAFIVEAKNEPKFDKEFVYILSDWNSKAEKGDDHLGAGHPETIMNNDITTINNRAVSGDNPVVMEAREGEKIRLRFANIGFLPHTLRFPDGFIVAYEDGYPVPKSKREESLTLYPGKTNDLVITIDNPGKKLFYHSVIMPEGLNDKLTEALPVQKHDGNHELDSQGNANKQRELVKEVPIIMVNVRRGGTQ